MNTTITSMGNATMPGASLVRITAEDYQRMAEYICAEVRPYSKTITGGWGNLEFEFCGWGIFGPRPYYPDDVIFQWVECYTLDDDGDVLRNNFRIDTLRAYIDEYIRECENEMTYPENCLY